MSMLANDFHLLRAPAKFRRPELNRFIIRQVHVLHLGETTVGILQPKADQRN